MRAAPSNPGAPGTGGEAEQGRRSRRAPGRPGSGRTGRRELRGRGRPGGGRPAAVTAPADMVGGRRFDPVRPLPSESFAPCPTPEPVPSRDPPPMPPGMPEPPRPEGDGPDADDGAVFRGQAGLSRLPACSFPDGRFLRALLRRRGQKASEALDITLTRRGQHGGIRCRWRASRSMRTKATSPG